MKLDYSEKKGERRDARYFRLQQEFNTFYPTPVSEEVIDIERMNDSFRMRDEKYLYE